MMLSVFIFIIALSLPCIVWTADLPVIRLIRTRSPTDCNVTAGTVMSTNYLFDTILKFDQIPVHFVFQIDGGVTSIAAKRVATNSSDALKRIGTSATGVSTFGNNSMQSCAIIGAGIDRFTFTLTAATQVLWFVVQADSPPIPSPYELVNQVQTGLDRNKIVPPRMLSVFDVDGDGFDDVVAASDWRLTRMQDEYVQVCRSTEPPRSVCANVTARVVACAAIVLTFANTFPDCVRFAVLSSCLAPVIHCAEATPFLANNSTCRLRPPLPRRTFNCALVSNAGVDDAGMFHRAPTTYFAVARGYQFALGTLEPTKAIDGNSTTVPVTILDAGVSSVLAYDANDDEMIDFSLLSGNRRWRAVAGNTITFQELNASGLADVRRSSIGITRPPPQRAVSVVQREQFLVLPNSSLSSFGDKFNLGVACSNDLDKTLAHLWIDCDNDGDQDVIITCKNAVKWLENVDGVLSDARAPVFMFDAGSKILSAAVGDINRDGVPDIGGTVLVGSYARLFGLYGYGKCQFDAIVGTSSNETDALATMIDADRDGDVDVVSVTANGFVFSLVSDSGNAGPLEDFGGVMRALLAWPDSLRVNLTDAHGVRTPFLSHVELRDSTTGALVAAQQLTPSYGNMKPSSMLTFSTGDMVRYYTSDGAPRRFVDVIVHFASNLMRNMPIEKPTIVVAAHWSDKIISLLVNNLSPRRYSRPVQTQLKFAGVRDATALAPPANTPVGSAAYSLSLVCNYTVITDPYRFAQRAFRVRVVSTEPANSPVVFDVDQSLTQSPNAAFFDASLEEAAAGFPIRLFTTARSLVFAVAPLLSINDDRSTPETMTASIVLPLNAVTATAKPPTVATTTTTPATSATPTTMNMTEVPSPSSKNKDLRGSDDDASEAIIIAVSVIGAVVVIGAIIGMVVCYRAKHKYGAKPAKTKQRLIRNDSGAAVDIPDTRTFASYTTAPPAVKDQYDAAPHPREMYGVVTGLGTYDHVPPETSELNRNGGGETTTSSSSSKSKRSKKHNGYETAPEIEVEEDDV